MRDVSDTVMTFFDGQVTAGEETEAFFQSSWLWR